MVDGAGSMHGVTHTIERIREHGVPGWEVEVIGTDPRVDRRLPAVAEVEVPFYPGPRVGVPSLPELAETLADGATTWSTSSRRARPASAPRCARIGGIPLVGSYHTELAAYAGIRTGDAQLEAGARLALALFYGQCEVVLSPSPAADQSLLGLGVDSRPDRALGAWGRSFALRPGAARPRRFPGEVKVLYAGRLAKEKGVDLLAEAFLRRASAIRACTSCSRVAARRRTRCASALGRARRRSWAGWGARSSPAPTRAPTCSCSALAPTPTGR